MVNLLLFAKTARAPMFCSVKGRVDHKVTKRKWFWPATLILVSGGFNICSGSMAQVPRIPEATHLPPQTTPIAHVVVPIPRETIASLDRYGDVNWSAVQRSRLAHFTPHSDPTGIALLMGVLIG
jgi:hypothetical protein